MVISLSQTHIYMYMFMYIPFLLLTLEIKYFSPDIVSYTLNHNIPLLIMLIYFSFIFFKSLIQSPPSSTLRSFAKTLVSRYLSKETPTHVLHKKRDFSQWLFRYWESETLSFFPAAESQRQLAKAIVASGRGRSADLSCELTRGRRPLSALCRYSGTLCFWAFRRIYGAGVV